MLNIELAVLQTLDQSEWWTLTEISAQSRIQEQAAEEALQDLNDSGIVESRQKLAVNGQGPAIVEWRSLEDSLLTYLQQKVPNYCSGR